MLTFMTDSPEAHYQRRFRRRGKTPCVSSTPGNDVTNAILHRWEKKKKGVKPLSPDPESS